MYCKLTPQFGDQKLNEVLRLGEVSWDYYLQVVISLYLILNFVFSLLIEWPSCIEGLGAYKYPHPSFCKGLLPI